MAIPAPEPGLVVNYAYLWHNEYETGAEEGRKDRPSVIVLCVEGAEGETVVTVLPITHRSPNKPADAVMIPAAVGSHLGLDAAQSWIVIAEGNEFIWPGYDLRRRPDGRYVYGFLPPRFFDKVREAFVAYYRSQRRALTPRD
jgi:hypothetical protein